MVKHKLSESVYLHPESSGGGVAWIRQSSISRRLRKQQVQRLLLWSPQPSLITPDVTSCMACVCLCLQPASPVSSSGWGLAPGQGGLAAFTTPGLSGSQESNNNETVSCSRHTFPPVPNPSQLLARWVSRSSRGVLWKPTHGTIYY